MKKNKRYMKWSTKMMKGSWGGFILLTIIIAFLALMNTLNAASLKLMIDIATGDSSHTVLIGFAFTMFVISLTAVLNFVQSYVRSKTVYQISSHIKSDLLSHLERLPFLSYKKYHTGDLLTRLSDDAGQSARVYPESIISLMAGILSSLFAVCYSLYLNWKLTLLVVVLSPLALIWSKILLPKVQKFAYQARSSDSELRSFTQEQLANVDTIKCFSNYQISQEKFNRLFHQNCAFNMKQIILSAIMENGGTILGFFTFAGSVGFGVWLVQRGEMTVGAVVGFVQLMNFFVWPFTEMMGLLGNIQAGFASTSRVLELFDLEEEVIPEVIPIDRTGSICLSVEHLFFSYQGEEPVIKDVNLNVATGKITGIVGESGSGKSTFLKLLLCLLKPDSGSITVFHGDKATTGTAIRNYIAYVPQDHLLFSGTIEENIRFGRIDATHEDVVQAAKKAYIHDFISSLPEGYETIVKENASNISFGEAQRVAIARALVRDVPILILDEPTASLDKESETYVMRTLRMEVQNKICLVVSHNENAQSYYDNILHIKNG